MQLTVKEKVYLTGYVKSLKNKSEQEAMAMAFEAEQDLLSCRPSNNRRVSDIVRKLSLASHQAGLFNKLESEDGNGQAIIISGLENINAGTRNPIGRGIIDALINSGLKFIGLYLCEDGQNPDDYTYVCIVDIRPDSDDHKAFLAAAAEHNLDIRITSREWFNEAA